jgi:hypothetical protein
VVLVLLFSIGIIADANHEGIFLLGKNYVLG